MKSGRGPDNFKRVRHGMCGHPLYQMWNNMRFRCYNKRYRRYKDWGGRGIKVCREWKNDPRPFIAWARRKRWKPGLEIDRKNNDRGYSPSNCRLVTAKIQASNRRPIRNKKAWIRRISVGQKLVWASGNRANPTWLWEARQ